MQREISHAHLSGEEKKEIVSARKKGALSLSFPLSPSLSLSLSLFPSLSLSLFLSLYKEDTKDTDRKRGAEKKGCKKTENR